MNLEIVGSSLCHFLFDKIKDCVAIYEAVNDGENFRFVDLNPAGEKSESLKKEDVVGKLVTEVFPGVKEFGILKVFQQVYRDGIHQNLPITFYEDSRIGGWRDNNIYKLDENHIVAVYNDLTKEKQIEAELKLSAKIFETSFEGILVADKTTKTIKVNKAFLEMSGYSEDEVLNRKANRLKSGIHDKEFYKNMWSSINEIGYWEGEIWNRKKNGESFAVFLNISAIHDEDGVVENYVGIYLDITDKKRAQENIYRLAYCDILTDLANRTQFELEVENFINRSEKNGEKFGFLIVDIDNFKYINDSYGHNVGDLLLKQIASRLKKIVRKVDFLGRVGGDEFVVLMDEIQSNKEVGILATNILSSLEEPFDVGSDTFQISCSIGISVYPSDGDNRHTLLKNAETAMYQSKKEGKNRFYFHTPDMNREFSTKLELDKYLRQAIKEEQFEMYYQPKICANSKNVMGAESLIRWNNPTLGFVSPGEFIPYAEESGMIIPIGDFVLRSVCGKVKEFQDLGLPLKIALNISSLQLKEDDFIEKVKSVIKSTGCDPTLLEFEITESKIMENIESNIEKLIEIRGMGITIAIDDFGTGYSSMSYLRRLPIDILKVDKSFVDDIPHQADGNLIVKGILSLTSALSLKSVAEGVESAEQSEFLRENGCDMIQGYLYSKPLKVDDFIKFVKDRA